MTQIPPQGTEVRDPTRSGRGESLHRRGHLADTNNMGHATTSARGAVSQLAPSAFAVQAPSMPLEPLVGCRRERAHLEKTLRDAVRGAAPSSAFTAWPGPARATWSRRRSWRPRASR